MTLYASNRLSRERGNIDGAGIQSHLHSHQVRKCKLLFVIFEGCAFFIHLAQEAWREILAAAIICDFFQRPSARRRRHESGCQAPSARCLPAPAVVAAPRGIIHPITRNPSPFWIPSFLVTLSRAYPDAASFSKAVRDPWAFDYEVCLLFGFPPLSSWPDSGFAKGVFSIHSRGDSYGG